MTWHQKWYRPNVRFMPSPQPERAQRVLEHFLGNSLARFQVRLRIVSGGSHVMDAIFGDSDQPILIPSRQLTGTREAKLAQLEGFLLQLHVVRRALGGEPLGLGRVEPSTVDVHGLERRRVRAWIRHVHGLLTGAFCRR